MLPSVVGQNITHKNAFLEFAFQTARATSPTRGTNPTPADIALLNNILCKRSSEISNFFEGTTIRL